MVLANAPNEDCVVATGGRQCSGFIFSEMLRDWRNQSKSTVQRANNQPGWILPLCCLAGLEGALPWPFFWGQVAVPEGGLLAGAVTQSHAAAQLPAGPYCQTELLAGLTCFKALAWVWVKTRRRMIWHTFPWFDILCGYSMVCPPQEIQNTCFCAGTNLTVPDKLFMWKDTICMVVIKASVCIHLWKHVRHHMSLICLWYVGVWIIFHNCWMAYV